MKRSLKLILSIITGLSMHMVYAEGNCPPGYYPIDPSGTAPTQGCYPVSNDDDSSNNTSPPPKPWHDRYGAISIDSTQGVFGVAANEATKNSAKNTAISNCQSKGGSNCKIKQIYYNSCVVVVTGDKASITSSDVTLTKSETKAMDLCKKEDTNCEVLYKACSLPVQY